MLIHYLVPDETPLTNENYATQVVAVLNTENEPCGVYPNPQRAFQYAKQANPDAHVEMYADLSGGFRIAVNGENRFSVHKTIFRL